MIGYKVGSSPVEIDTTGKTSLTENFNHGWKKWHDCQHGKNFSEVKFLGYLRAALHYSGEVHRSCILGEFQNLVGQEQHLCPVVVYTTTKSPLVEKIVHGWKNDMDANVATFFFEGDSPEVKFLGYPQSLGQETWPPENSNSNRISYRLFIFSGIPSLASNNHVLGWNSWPTGALVHHSVKLPLKPSTWAGKNSNSRHLSILLIYTYIHYYYSILSVIPTVTINNLVLGWNSWPTGALVNHSWKPAPLHRGNAFR